MRFRFSRRSLTDLREIGLYIAQDNPTRAASFVRDLRIRCILLGEHPFSGRPRPELGPEARSTVFGRYVILYDVRDAVVEIQRVAHGARDLRRLMKP